MPTPGAHYECGNLLVKRVGLAFRAHVFDSPLDRVSEIDLPLDSLTPVGGLRILEVGHVCVCPRIEGVDHHLGVARRSCDLDSPVLKVWRGRPDPPAALADPAGLRKEVREYPRVYLPLPQSPSMQKLVTSSGETTDHQRQKLDYVSGEDVTALL